MSAKFEKELQHLVSNNVISEAVSKNISEYYASQKIDSPNKLFTIFGVLGSVLVGLGIVLILAHNWDGFSRTVKTIWAFIPLVIGQLFTGFVILKKKSAAWKETAAAFLFFAIGASISLVSQIYNIPGSMPSFLLTWIVLAAPLIYLLRSHTATLLHLIFATSYACNLGYFNEAIPWAYLAMLAWILPFYYNQIQKNPDANITGIYHWFICLSLIISLGSFISGSELFGFLIYILLFGLFYNLGKLPFFDTSKLRANAYLLTGSLGMVFILMVSSFHWFWEEGSMSRYGNVEIALALVLGLATIGVILYLFKRKKMNEFNLFQYAAPIFAIVYLLPISDKFIPVILINILTFALGVFAIRIGVKRARYSILNYGMLIIATLIACRFFDTEISFVIRGLLFVGIGIGFFATNYFMYKKQKQLSNE